MSVINDALKKVQNRREARAVENVPAPHQKPEPPAGQSQSPATEPPAEPTIIKRASEAQKIDTRPVEMHPHPRPTTPPSSKEPTSPLNMPSSRVPVWLALVVVLAATVTIVFVLKKFNIGLKPLAVASPTDQFKINGIIVQGGKKLVVINDQLYEEGDTINGKTILNIFTHNIVIKENGEEKIIKVR